jgi:hypothetical protein
MTASVAALSGIRFLWRGFRRLPSSHRHRDAHVAQRLLDAAAAEPKELLKQLDTEADDRPRMVGRRVVPTRWQGWCCDYREMNGCRIPTRAVASWLLEDGPFEYWRGRVTAFGMK